MLDFFQRIAKSKFVPNPAALREMELEIERGKQAELQLKTSQIELEKQISSQMAELARTNGLLEQKVQENQEVTATVSAIGESIPFGVWIYEKSGKVRFISQSLLDLMEVKPDANRDWNWWDLLPASAREKAAAAWAKCMSTDCSWDFEFELPRKDGTFHTIMSRGVPVKSAAGKVLYYAGVQLDVTERVRMTNELKAAHENLETQIHQRTLELNEANRQLTLDLVARKKTEDALRKSETQLRALYDNSLDAIVVLDDNRRFTDANPSALALFGISKEVLSDFTIDSLVPQGQRASMLEDWRLFLIAGEQWGERKFLLPDGSECTAQFSAKANFVAGRHLFSFRDITRRREAEQSLSQLSQRLLQTQDEERRRIARELHDSTGQCLAAVRMNLQILKKDEGKLGPDSRKCLDEAFAISSQCASDVRTLSYLLHPPLLDELGLVAALGWYTAGYSERSGVKVSFEVAPDAMQLPQDIGTALYRIVQESLTNIHRHSHSPTASIRLFQQGKEVVLEVSDQGRGLPAGKTESTDQGVRGLGVGIAGMRERVKQLGGTLKISPANPGTIVTVTLPWEADNASVAASNC